MGRGSQCVDYDIQSEDPANAVVMTIAAYSNQELDKMPPLFNSVDPDGLNSVVDSMEDGRVSFSHAGYEVTVTGGSQVSIEELSE